MAVTYTTALIVQKRVKSLSAALLTADIEENISQAESIVDAVMKQTARGTGPDFTFSATKHGIIRNATTDLAAYSCITYDPGEFVTIETAEMVANLLWDSAQALLILLSDVRIVEYLKSL